MLCKIKAKLFIPKKYHPVMTKMRFYTIWIALALILIFILQKIINGFTDLFVLNQLSYFQPWRFVTAIFLHGSVVHLISNLFALLLFGLILEKVIGSKRFLFVFFASGIFASLVAVNFYSASLGASGAIMGVIGTLAIIKPLMLVWAFGMVIPMIVAAIFWVILDLLGIFVPDNVGNIAHLSGIFIGVIIGFFLRAKHEKRKKSHTIQIPEHILRRWETLYME